MAKIKLSVTIDSGIVQALDRAARATTRSEVVERALASWLRSERSRQLEAEVEAYYAALSPEEEGEDAAWAKLGHGATPQTWS